MNTGDDVKTFMLASEQEVFDQMVPINQQACLYMDLCKEEFHELHDSFKSFDRVNVAKEAMDLVWVVIGLCHSMGIPLQEVWNEVARSNLSKIVDGKVIKNAAGKVMKPVGWTPPNIDAVVHPTESNHVTSISNKSEH